MKQIEDLDDLVTDRLYYIYNRAEGKEFYVGRFVGVSVSITAMRYSTSGELYTPASVPSLYKSDLFFDVEFDSCQLNRNYNEVVEMDDDYEGIGYSKIFSALEFMNTLLIFSPEPEELWFLI